MKALMAAADGGGLSKLDEHLVLSKLENLDIAFNDTIGEEGIEALAEAIIYCAATPHTDHAAADPLPDQR